MNLQQRVSLLKALADASRLQVASALLEGPHCVEEIAERLSLSPSTVSFHLRKLEEAELVTKAKAQYYMVYKLRTHLLGSSLLELVRLPADDTREEQKRLELYRKKVLDTFFEDGRLVQLPRQWKKRIIVLEEILTAFEPGREYDETEVNDKILLYYPDYCNVRRMLVDERYMVRDGRHYRVVAQQKEKEGESMETRAEIKRQYKQTDSQAGLFQVRNTATGKILLGSTRNLHGALNKHRFLLRIRKHPNAELQHDWDELGSEHFEFEVLEVVKRTDDPSFSLEEELSLLEEIWMEKCLSDGEKAYNEGRKIRE